MVAEGAARRDDCPARVLPYTVALVPHLDKSKLRSDGGDGVASCHESVLVGEQGQGGDRFIMPDLSELPRDGVGADAQLWLQA